MILLVVPRNDETVAADIEHNTAENALIAYEKANLVNPVCAVIITPLHIAMYELNPRCK